ncbi:protein NKG7-like [Heteronotia binoei]|uniref:protein NKG7-like n=1 Tax=Heteronotia binoei TaxID=13085 RepID=UPI00292E31AC|nr:protein NKG7-like [Heteronotia binoei]
MKPLFEACVVEKKHTEPIITDSPLPCQTTTRLIVLHAEPLRITACFFSFVSLLLSIIALASNYWVQDLEGTHAGLWKVCRANICMSYGMDVHAYEHIVRAFLLMGVAASIISFFGLCASFFLTHIGSIPIKLLTVSASIVAAVCSVVAMAIHTAANYRQFSGIEMLFGWSFGLGWALFPLFLITSEYVSDWN